VTATMPGSTMADVMVMGVFLGSLPKQALAW
jgi:hypothetical protein